MLGAARQRVGGRGLRNVTLLLGDAQVFALEQGAFDLATSRMGVMFFADPAAAFRNIGSALKSSGRLVFACWGPLAENRHWLISYDVALRHLGPPAPQPAHEPSPLAFADPDYIRGVLAAAGFVEITVDRAHPTIIGGSPEEEARQALAMGPTARLIEEKKPTEATRQVDRPRNRDSLRRRSPIPARSTCPQPSFSSPPAAWLERRGERYELPNTAPATRPLCLPKPPRRRRHSYATERMG